MGFLYLIIRPLALQAKLPDLNDRAATIGKTGKISQSCIRFDPVGFG